MLRLNKYIVTKNRMSKRCKLQKEYYKKHGGYKGNGKYCDNYVSWLEEQVLVLRTHDAAERSEQLKAFLHEIENDKTYILNEYYKNKAKRIRESP